MRKQKSSQLSQEVSSVAVGLIYTKPGLRQDSNQQLVRVLLDSGSTSSIIYSKHVKHLTPTATKPVRFTTKAGTFATTRKCVVSLNLPSLQPDKTITWNFYVDEQQSTHYDIILGRDVLMEVGIDLMFSEKKIVWEGSSISMRDPTQFKNKTLKQLERETFQQDQVEEDFIQRMTEEKYSPADLKKEVEKCSHLTSKEKSQLLNLLRKYNSLFDGSLGTWKTTPVELELQEGAKPYHGRPYPVPKSQEKKLKDEIKRLEKYGVLKKINHSEWGMPSFTIVKKDGITLRSIADLRELNKRIKRKPFPIPKIQELLLKLEKFKFGTSLDLNMGYYHIVLSPNSRKMCTVVFPWGKYEYTRLPMGLCNSPDIFQEKMGELMQDLEFTRAYIDDLLVISTGSFEDHLNKLEQVFTRLVKAGLKVNASKSSFCAES